MPPPGFEPRTSGFHSDVFYRYYHGGMYVVRKREPSFSNAPWTSTVIIVQGTDSHMLPSGCGGHRTPCATTLQAALVAKLHTQVSGAGERRKLPPPTLRVIALARERSRAGLDVPSLAHPAGCVNSKCCRSGPRTPVLPSTCDQQAEPLGRSTPTSQ